MPKQLPKNLLCPYHQGSHMACGGRLISVRPDTFTCTSCQRTFTPSEKGWKEVKPSAIEAAITAHRKEVLKKQAQHITEHEEERQSAKALFTAWFGFAPEAILMASLDSAPRGPKIAVKSGDLILGYSVNPLQPYTEYFQVKGRCPKCNGACWSIICKRIEDIGMMIGNFVPDTSRMCCVAPKIKLQQRIQDITFFGMCSGFTKIRPGIKPELITESTTGAKGQVIPVTPGTIAATAAETILSNLIDMYGRFEQWWASIPNEERHCIEDMMQERILTASEMIGELNDEDNQQKA